MGRRNLFAVVCVLLFGLPVRAQDAPGQTPPRAESNDNRTPAGELKNGVLELRLELREARWYPEDDASGFRDVYAFGEEGRAPQIPAPLLRVPQGTQIHLRVRNTLALAAKIHGLHRHPGELKDTIDLAPGESRDLAFVAGEPGTYNYWATTSADSLDDRTGKDKLLGGAFVVDATANPAPDRIWVINIWTDLRNKLPGEISTINGRSWPYTDRLTLKQGEPVHWRVIDLSQSDHAMHLHGFFFDVDGVGDGERYTTYAADQRPRAVTQHIDLGETFEMTWTPDRPGNWLFHCHMFLHMVPSDALHPADAHPAAHSPDHDMAKGMGGLIIGLTVLPDGSAAPAAAWPKDARKLQLLISDNPDKLPLYKIEVIDPRAPEAPPAPDSKPAPSFIGPPIILTRGEPVEIEVKNNTQGPTAIHWHGMELESYYDGVPGWTGSGEQITPPIAPGSSFVARMTPPRAGTYIYHTHWHDRQQILNGLYGPLIVLDPGQKFDSDHDKIFIWSLGKYAPFGYMSLVNGKPETYPVRLKTGTRYRLRLINMSDNLSDMRVRLLHDGVPVQWKIISRDGADLPPAQLKTSTADMGLTVGETVDVEYQADSAGNDDLEFRMTSFPMPSTVPLVFAAGK